MSGEPGPDHADLVDDDVEALREDLRHRRWLVFVSIVIAATVLTGLAWWLAGAPTCENPDNNWMPCWSPR